MARVPGTGPLSEGLLRKGVYGTYASKVSEIRSAVSCKSFELRNVDDFFAGPMRWLWDSGPDCPAIKLSESATSEPQPGQVVPE